MTGCITVLCTVPDIGTGESIAKELVGKKIAACVNIVPQLQSVYAWKGEICNESESLLIIKTEKTHFNSLKSTIVSLHPYEVPEIVSLDIADGLESYISWVKESTN